MVLLSISADVVNAFLGLLQMVSELVGLLQMVSELVIPQILISVFIESYVIIGLNWILLTTTRSPNCNLTSPFGVQAQMWLALSLGCYIVFVRSGVLFVWLLYCWFSSYVLLIELAAFAGVPSFVDY